MFWLKEKMGEKVPPESEAGGNPGLSSRPNHATQKAQNRCASRQWCPSKWERGWKVNELINKVSRCRPIKLQELKWIPDRLVSFFLFSYTPIITEHGANNLVMVKSRLTSIINSTLHIHSALKSESHVNRSLNPTMKLFGCFLRFMLMMLEIKFVPDWGKMAVVSGGKTEVRRNGLKWPLLLQCCSDHDNMRASSLFLNWSSW